MVEQVNQGLVAVEITDADRDAARRYFDGAYQSGLAFAFATVRCAERERCARIAEEHPRHWGDHPYAKASAEKIATAIRSSSEGPNHDR